MNIPLGCYVVSALRNIENLCAILESLTGLTTFEKSALRVDCSSKKGRDSVVKQCSRVLAGCIEIMGLIIERDGKKNFNIHVQSG